MPGIGCGAMVHSLKLFHAASAQRSYAFLDRMRTLGLVAALELLAALEELL